MARFRQARFEQTPTKSTADSNSSASPTPLKLPPVSDDPRTNNDNGLSILHHFSEQVSAHGPAAVLEMIKKVELTTLGLHLSQVSKAVDQMKVRGFLFEVLSLTHIYVCSKIFHPPNDQLCGAETGMSKDLWIDNPHRRIQHTLKRKLHLPTLSLQVGLLQYANPSACVPLM
jgi:hypothetical protein